MEQQQLKRCPIGIQTFEEIINKDHLYIDKTDYIYRMSHGASKFYFLSCPRRFGKSLLVSTLHNYWPTPEIYNPFSLLNAFEDAKLNSYWFGSGMSTYLIEMLRNFHILPSELRRSVQAMATSFDAPTERMTNIMPLLYQSGYITIRDYDKLTELYTLDIPNREIRVGSMQSL